MRTFNALALCCVLAAPARAAKTGFDPAAAADLRGAYSTVGGSDDSGGAIGSVALLPAWRFSENSTLLPMYTFEGLMYDRVVEEDVLYLTRQVHGGSLGYRHGFGPLSVKVSGDFARALTKEARNESLGNGLYDYQDFGGRVSGSWELGEGRRKAPATLSVRVYNRSYPNYSSLAQIGRTLVAGLSPDAAASVGDKEKDPRDYLGIDSALGGAWWFGDSLRVNGGYALGVRSYGDKYLRTDQGLISDTKRSDLVHRIDLGSDLGHGRFVYGLDLASVINSSNASLYDSTQPRHAYLKGYYNFMSFAAMPSVTWSLPFGGARAPKVRLGGSFLTRSYPDRYTLEADGFYGDTKQSDTEFGADLRGWYPFAKWISGTLGVNYRSVSSNRKFDLPVKSNYALTSVSAGVSLTY